mmetsp:Transcript_3655/g.8747  ORF Transcript_3655/g.8747 Transcript_3655/m.8747 type:complete len:211 (-) Transcript_3655:377-1009(-)
MPTSAMSSGSHSLPWPRGACAIMRDRTRDPTPQLRLQALHSCHSRQLQSMSVSQVSVPHAPISTSPPSHGFPPARPTVSTLRVRFLCPPPQVLVHSLQLPQAESTQSCFSLQGESLQASVSTMAPSQGRPRWLDSVTTILVRLRWPPPQLWSQDDQDPHSDSTQSCGGLEQSGVHEAVSTFGPSHGFPQSFDCCAMTRCLSCSPSHVQAE